MIAQRRFIAAETHVAPDAADGARGARVDLRVNRLRRGRKLFRQQNERPFDRPFENFPVFVHELAAVVETHRRKESQGFR